MSQPPTVVIDPTVAPDSARVKSPTVASRTHLRTMEGAPDGRLSWISVSHYNLARLTLTERLHLELRDLGAIEILVGVIEMLFGLPLLFAESYSYPAMIGIPWVAGIWYVLAGSLVIHLIHSRTLFHKRLILVTQVLSGLAAMVSCIIHNLSLFYLPTTPYHYFMTAPLLLSLFLMLFSVLHFIISLLICYLYISVLNHNS
ncbi:uncharacterized protein [Mobula birostris]|uniref:uncharacterized protein isoform X1 n=1 Tax=Mobula birostris TaxID=1983395 RepID=UPI003B28C27A